MVLGAPRCGAALPRRTCGLARRACTTASGRGARGDPATVDRCPSPGCGTGSRMRTELRAKADRWRHGVAPPSFWRPLLVVAVAGACAGRRKGPRPGRRPARGRDLRDRQQINAQQGEVCQAQIEAQNAADRPLIGEEARPRQQEAAVQARARRQAGRARRGDAELRRRAGLPARGQGRSSSRPIGALAELLVRHLQDATARHGRRRPRVDDVDRRDRAGGVPRAASTTHQDAVIAASPSFAPRSSATVEELTAARERGSRRRATRSPHTATSSPRRARSSRPSTPSSRPRSAGAPQTLAAARRSREQQLQEQISPGACPPGGADGDDRRRRQGDRARERAARGPGRDRGRELDRGRALRRGAAATARSSPRATTARARSPTRSTAPACSRRPLDSGGLDELGRARAAATGSRSTRTPATPSRSSPACAGTPADDGGSGPSWYTDMRSSAGYVVRHPAGL